MYDSTSLLDRDREGKSSGLREQGAKFHCGFYCNFIQGIRWISILLPVTGGKKI